MKIAHLIMAHKNPDQLGRLLTALQHDDFYFFIHLDSKCDFKDYEHLASQPRVEFTPRRFAVRWASYRFTHAILEGTRAILASGQPFDFINLLSGQDYPIKPAATIHDFFARHKGYSFLSFESEGSPWWQHATSRIEQYHTTYFQFKGQYLLQRFLNLVLPRRQFPLPYALYGGSDGSWWTLDAACAAYLVKFIDEHPRLRWFSMFTWGSDEFLIATVLMNSAFKSSIINENYRYIDWSAGGANPRLLTTDDFPKLAHAHKLFARKFDADHDHNLLNLVDDWLVRHRPRTVAAG
ncbi:glycosyltransferase [Hymenobacter sp. BRD128]|uniref:beta-1,6-N-acetylglucosaminyltransferase n=1 Tax=Hymenobacter sp. BRD128 TaxID=2675878 RepID=UPI0015644C4F|nr:beta-1,6-N-acetylglucosaminyltransferase [Hymenobacter sp. BRD128]QKG57439.1 glycosyltransferase [Hymenobacter sp. BRD128]